MEEDTMDKSTDELLRHLFNKLALVENDANIANATLAEKMETVNSSINARIEAMTSEIRSLFETLKPAEDRSTNSMSNTSLEVAHSHSNGILPNPSLNDQSDMTSNETENSSTPENHPKPMDFPKFNRQNPRAWVLETVKYFNNNPMADSDKIDLYASKYCDYSGMPWSEFVDSVLTGFQEPGQNHFIVDFHQLRQHGSVNDYLSLWMDLKEITSVVYPDLPENYYLNCFIGGLKEKTRSDLWTLQPESLDLAINIARYVEDISETTSNSVLDEEAIEKDYAEISMNTLSGFSSYQSIRLLGKVGNHEITILVDFCSSHSFIKESTANHLRCSLKERTPPLPVTSPNNGSTVYSFFECPEFSWVMKGNEFKTDHVYIHNDLGCDLVLGLNWLKQIGPIEVDYKTMELTVFRNGKPIVLTG